MDNPLKRSNYQQDEFSTICEHCKSVCCKGARPPVIPRRAHIIKEYLLSRKISIEEPFEKSNYTFPREREEYCIFFDAERIKCLIHSAKPETCVAGPITFDINLKKACIEWYLKTGKSCALAGTLYLNKDKLREHLSIARREILILLDGLSPMETHTILRIEEPETFKIAEDQLDPHLLVKLHVSPQHNEVVTHHTKRPSSELQEKRENHGI